MDQKAENLTLIRSLDHGGISVSNARICGERYQRNDSLVRRTTRFIGDPFPDKEPFVFAILRLDDVEIMLQRIEGYKKPDLYNSRSGGVWDAYFRVEGIKELFESVRHDATIVKPLRRQPYGNWEFEVKDPNGYLLVFSEPS